MSGSMRTCTSCQMQFRANSHRDRRFQCYVCKPDRKNVSMQSNKRRANATRDALARLTELEDKVEQLAVQFDFYGSSIETIRDTVIEDVIGVTQQRVQQVTGEIIERLVNKRITDFKEGMWAQMRSIDNKHEAKNDVVHEQLEDAHGKIGNLNVKIHELQQQIIAERESMKEVFELVGEGKTAESVMSKSRKTAASNLLKNRLLVSNISIPKGHYKVLVKIVNDCWVRAEREEKSHTDVDYEMKAIALIMGSALANAQRYTRELREMGLIGKRKITTPFGERGVRYRYHITNATLDHFQALEKQKEEKSK